MASLQVGDQIELHIDSLSYGGGRGVGRHQGFVFFVPYSAPGDRLLVEVTLLKKSHGEARILKILKPSLHRESPLCPVFGECGGCRFQHIAYEEQLRQKDAYIRQALRRLPIGEIQPILPSPRPFHYRNRIQVHIRQSQFGFLKPKSNELIPIEGCFIAEEPIHDFLSRPEAQKELKAKGARKVELIIDKENRLNLRGVEESAELLQFSQVNRFQNENLVETIVNWAKQCKSHSEGKITAVLDLYSGSGNLTFPIYEALCLPVTAVELSGKSVAAARKRTPKGAPIQFEVLSVDRYLKARPSDLDLSSTLVVSDPPREGLTRGVAERLISLKPPFLIHVGCDLMNFTRDLRKFSENGYELEEVQPLDMFPQTDHVELIARLRVKGS